MDPMLSGLSVAAIAVVIFVSSLLARLFKAKRYQFYWVLIPWALAVVAVIASNIYQLDGLHAIGVGIAAFIILFKLVTGLEMLSSLTVTVASLAMISLSLAGGAYALNKSGAEGNEFVATAVGFVPESQFYDLSFFGREKPQEDLYNVEEEELFFSEADLLPMKIQAKNLKLAEKAFKEMSPYKANSVKGARVRLFKQNGDLVKGNIVGLEGNNLIIAKSVASKGIIRAPVPLASIKKLEVYH